MSWLIIIALSALALFGAPIFAVMGGFAAFGASISSPDDVMGGLAGFLVNVFAMLHKTEADALSTIPLFTFMGYVLAESKTAERLVRFANAVVGWFPGGLALVTIMVCALFTTVTGASGVTIVAVGGLVMPALIRQGYKERFSLGLITSTGSIGLLFPPSLPLIIFGIIYGISAQMSASGGGDVMELSNFSLNTFLLAGIVPGLILVGIIGVYCVYVAMRDKVPRTPFIFKNAALATIRALPELLIPLLMIVMLAKGFQIPEAAAFTTCYVVLLEVIGFRDLKFSQLPKLVGESMRLVGSIFILIVAATALTAFFVMEQVPQHMTEWILAHTQSRWTFLLALNVFLLLVGCVMDIFSALLIVVPLIVMPAKIYGIDPYHLGVIFLLNLEIGYVHPPVGLNLFVSSFRFRKPMTELYWSVVPFLILMVVALLLVTYVPAVVPFRVEDSTKVDTSQAGGGAPAAGVDASAGPTITFPDGTVHPSFMPDLPDGTTWTPAICGSKEIVENPDTLAKITCDNMFVWWAKCEAMEDAMDKLECENKVRTGEDPGVVEGGDAADDW